jgi:hypothetical protein
MKSASKCTHSFISFACGMAKRGSRLNVNVNGRDMGKFEKRGLGDPPGVAMADRQRTEAAAAAGG